MLRWQPSEKLEVEPNPVLEGADVEITFTGESTLYASVDGGDWVAVDIDADHHATFNVPPGTRVLVFSDRGDVPNNVAIEVISQG